MNQLIVCSLCGGGYGGGISLFARKETIRQDAQESSSVATLLLFSPCLVVLGLLVLWNHLDTTRAFLLSFSGLFIGWVIVKAIMMMKNTRIPGSIGQGVSMLLAGICSVDALAVSLFAPALMAPCYLAQFSAQILQKKFAAT